MNSLEIQKLDALRGWMSQWHSVLVSHSGGVDSALLTAIASQELGDRALACIGVSPSYPKREKEAAVKLVNDLGVRLRLVETDESKDPNFAANRKDRCYHCKSALFSILNRIAREEGCEVVVDGNNTDDLSDDRPGRIAAQEEGVRSPLTELGFSKADVRAIAKHLGLPVWDKPAMACLSSRVPHGSPITPKLLCQIETGEDVLAELGFRQFRLRHHGNIARIELPLEDIPKAMELREIIVEGVRKVGYRFVCLDLAGFRGTPPIA